MDARRINLIEGTNQILQQSNALAWAGILVPTMTALAAAIIGVINALRTSVVAAKTEEISKHSEVIAEKTVQMEQQGNSRWGEQEKKLAKAVAEVSELKMLVAQLLPEARAAGVKRADEREAGDPPALTSRPPPK